MREKVKTPAELFAIAKREDLSTLEQANLAGMKYKAWQAIRRGAVQLGVIKGRASGTIKVLPATCRVLGRQINVPVTAVDHLGAKSGDRVIFAADGPGRILVTLEKGKE